MKVFYPNLNPLRFIAAALVVIHHIEQNEYFAGLDSRFSSPVIVLFGKLGVDIFFVLSGFLITSLLLVEKQQFGRVAVGKFYMRRILRIWPLYFLIALLALFVWPQVPALQIQQMADPRLHFVPNILLIFLFLPNLQLVLFKSIAYEAQAWSIGVEEQFYVIWPWLVNLSKNTRRFKRLVILFLAGYIIIKLALYFIPVITHSHYKLQDYAEYLTYIFQIDCMLIGALFGLFNNEGLVKKILTSRGVQTVAWLLAIGLIAFGVQFIYFYWEVYGFLFGIIIFNLVNTKTSIINFEFGWLAYLGKISYSLYMWHVLVINLVIRFMTHNNVLIYLLTFVFSIGLAMLSYEFFEKPFLRLKTGYEKIQTGKVLISGNA